MANEEDRKQFNVRLNEMADEQLEFLSQKLNLSKGAVIKMAVAKLYESTATTTSVDYPPRQDKK